MATADSDSSDNYYDVEEYEDGPEPECMDCGGEGYVDSVAEVTGRWFWDDDGVGKCPNCGGSGLRKDQQWF